MSFLSGTVVLSMPIGSIISRYIYEYGGHLAIWCTTLICYISAILWVIFLIKDSHGKGSNLHNEEKREDEKNKEGSRNEQEEGCLSILKNLWKCFAVTFKSRPGNKRACLAIVISMRCISIVSDSKLLYRNTFELVYYSNTTIVNERSFWS